MRWYYKLVEKTPAYYRYAYSRESKKYDGVIVFFTATEVVKIDKPCDLDSGSNIKAEKAADHFWSVVNDGFPNEKEVCCG